MAGHRRKKGLALRPVERVNRRRTTYRERIATAASAAVAVRVGADYFATTLRDLPAEVQWEIAAPLVERLIASAERLGKAGAA